MGGTLRRGAVWPQKPIGSDLFYCRSIRFLLSHIRAVVRRADANELSKHMVEVGKRLETGGESGLLDAEMWITKPFFRALNLCPPNVVGESHARRLLEELAEVLRAQMNVIRHGAHRNTFSNVRVNELFGTLNCDWFVAVVCQHPSPRTLANQARKNTHQADTTHKPILRCTMAKLRLPDYQDGGGLTAYDNRQCRLRHVLGALRWKKLESKTGRPVKRFRQLTNGFATHQRFENQSRPYTIGQIGFVV
jgi:hypothetical protein